MAEVALIHSSNHLEVVQVVPQARCAVLSLSLVQLLVATSLFPRIGF